MFILIEFFYLVKIFSTFLRNFLEQGERIKKIRDQFDLTQKQLATAIGLEPYQIRDIELGKTKVSPEAAVKIENIYNVNMRWLFTGIGEMLIDTRGSSIVSESRLGYQHDESIDIVIKIMLSVSPEIRKDILRCAEERKLLSEMLAQQRAKKSA